MITLMFFTMVFWYQISFKRYIRIIHTTEIIINFTYNR